MKFSTPANTTHNAITANTTDTNDTNDTNDTISTNTAISNIYISSKLNIICDDLEYHKIIALDTIKQNEIIIREFSVINLFNERELDKGLQTIQKYILYKDLQSIQNLYPRSYIYPKMALIKSIHKIIKDVKQTGDRQYKQLALFFENIAKDEIEFYYAKYIYNAYDGYRYGPLTLPTIAKINHSCTPNVIHYFDTQTGITHITANQTIKKGDEILISYLTKKANILTLANHKKYLYEHYGFDCECIT